MLLLGVLCSVVSTTYMTFENIIFLKKHVSIISGRFFLNLDTVLDRHSEFKRLIQKVVQKVDCDTQ